MMIKVTNMFEVDPATLDPKTGLVACRVAAKPGARKDKDAPTVWVDTKIPSHKASFEQWVAFLGGEKEMRDFLEAAALVKIRAKIAAGETGAGVNGKPSY